MKVSHMDTVVDQDNPEALATFIERVARDFQRRENQ
jgi:hypothetical protein